MRRRKSLAVLAMGLSLLGLLLLAGFWDSTDPGDGPGKSTVPDGPIHFTTVSDEAGISFTHFNSRRDSLIPEDVGSGVGWADYDNDGDEDLYFVNFAGPFLMDPATLKQRAGNQLYRNDGNGKFTDVTTAAGIGHVGWDYGCLWLDVDNDGNLDLVLTHYQGALLYHNRGDGTFENQTDASGLGSINQFVLGMTAGDYDRDGDLDLFFCGYVHFDREKARNRPLVEGRPAVWTNPISYDPLPSILMRNNGEGVFEDVTAEAGVANPAGKSMQALFCDFNKDGWQDLYIANDVATADAMFLNNGDGTFEDVTTLSGTFDRRASMGVAVGDVWHAGLMDMFTTHWVNEDHALWRNRSGTTPDKSILMEDVGPTTGILKVKSTADVGWGIELIDFDNDGYLDLVLANGSTIEDELTLEVLKDPKLLPQRSRLLRNDGKANFIDISAGGGTFFQRELVARGLACADYDQDGRMDVAIVLHSGKGTLLRNTSTNTGNWLQVKLEGTASNRFGIGAQIEVTAGTNTYSRECVLSSSYLSSNSLVRHFGLGNADQADSVKVTWPSGTTSELKNVTLNQQITIQEK